MELNDNEECLMEEEWKEGWGEDVIEGDKWGKLNLLFPSKRPKVSSKFSLNFPKASLISAESSGATAVSSLAAMIPSLNEEKITKIVEDGKGNAEVIYEEIKRIFVEERQGRKGKLGEEEINKAPTFQISDTSLLNKIRQKAHKIGFKSFKYF